MLVNVIRWRFCILEYGIVLSFPFSFSFSLFFLSLFFAFAFLRLRNVFDRNSTHKRQRQISFTHQKQNLMTLQTKNLSFRSLLSFSSFTKWKPFPFP